MKLLDLVYLSNQMGINVQFEARITERFGMRSLCSHFFFLRKKDTQTHRYIEVEIHTYIEVENLPFIIFPSQVFQPSPADHEKYGGDPQHPHKLHIVTRIKSTKRRPYWEKDTIKMLGLEKVRNYLSHLMRGLNLL